MKIVLLEWAYDDDLADEAALLRRYETTTHWCEALQALALRRRDGRDERAAGDRADGVSPVSGISAVIRFHRETVVEHHGVTYHFCRDGATARPSAFAAPSRVADAIVRLSPDVVHVNGLGFAAQTWRLRQRLPASTAMVVQDHASGAPAAAVSTTDHVKQLLRRRMMRAPDGFLFTSVEQAEPWRAAGLIDPSQIVAPVIEASSSLAPVSMAEARRATGISGQPAILWVGRLNANKDPLCVLEAFARVRVTCPAATLTMVYREDDLLPEVRRRIERDARLRGGVRLVGAVPREHMVRYFSAADLFVVGSHHEGSGYALLEACACGALPAVSDIPAFRRITRDGAIGRLWTPGDPHACAVALIALLRVSGPVARANVRAHFQRALSWPVVAGDAEAAYGQAFAARQRRRAARSA